MADRRYSVNFGDYTAKSGGSPYSFVVPEAAASYVNPGQAYMVPYIKWQDPESGQLIDRRVGASDANPRHSDWYNPGEAMPFSQANADIYGGTNMVPVEWRRQDELAYDPEKAAIHKPSFWDNLVSAGAVPKWEAIRDHKAFLDQFPTLANAVEEGHRAIRHNNAPAGGGVFSDIISNVGGLASDLGPFLAIPGIVSGIGALSGALGGAGAGAGAGFNALHAADASWLPGSALGAAESAAAGLGAGTAVGSGLDFLANSPTINPSWLNSGGTGLSPTAVGTDVPTLAQQLASGGVTGAGPGIGGVADLLGAGAGAGAGIVNLANSGGPLVPETGVPAGSGGGTQAPAPVQSGPTTPGTGPGGSQAPLTSSAKEWLANKLGISTGAVDLLGGAASTLLGMYQANQQAGALGDLAAKAEGYGAPSRARYEGSFAPGFSMANEPGYKDALDSTSDSLLRRLSATGGNPFGNPGGLIETNKQINAGLALPALQNYRNQNAATGGFGAFNTAAPGLAANAAGQDNSWLTVLGGGLSNILNPPKQTGAADLASLMAAARQYGLV
jgi:hypothetical protein